MSHKKLVLHRVPERQQVPDFQHTRELTLHSYAELAQRDRKSPFTAEWRLIITEIRAETPGFELVACADDIGYARRHSDLAITLKYKLASTIMSMILRQTARVRMPARFFGAGISHLGSLRMIMEPSEIKYTASATASGAGRAGKVSVADSVPPLDAPFPMALPKSMGGNDQGVNPEQLFSAGYSACYLSALHSCAKKVGKKIDGAEVEVRTSIGPTPEDPGFALVVEMLVKGVNDQSIVDAAHKMCPYSRALNHGIKSTTKLV